MPRARANGHQIRLNNPALNGVVPPKNLRPMGTARTDTHATVSLYGFSFFSFFLPYLCCGEFQQQSPFTCPSRLHHMQVVQLARIHEFLAVPVSSIEVSQLLP
ncbi:hypothetical protein M407DRAFT_168344 [Tulasnella calospora MUT 4182]|uniref:Uncharacterized protein n=1 Tax=Tulasnella calospora MUT 4182 TaxID=1051891 RepID=A0A0C3QEB7_9AGAM|nr:hypothetical protein M407DRAFT_168344 [Tulasnella calospora MUT 4182]